MGGENNAGVTAGAHTDHRMSLTQLHQPTPNEAVEPFSPYLRNLDHLLDGLRLVELRIRRAIQLSRKRAALPQAQDQAYGLYITDSMVDQILAREPGQPWWQRENGLGESDPVEIGRFYHQWVERTRLTRSADVDLKLFRLAETFHLTQIEVDILLLAIAPELDLRFEQLYGFLNDDVTQRRPTIHLILTLLLSSYTEQNRFRSLFQPESPLVKWRLIEINGVLNQRQVPFGRRSIRPGEGVAAFLAGQPLPACGGPLGHAFKQVNLDHFEPAPWFPSTLWEQISETMRHNPILNFIGSYGVGQAEAAARLANQAGRSLFRLDLEALTQNKSDLVHGVSIAIRDCLLHWGVLFITNIDQKLIGYQLPEQLLDLLQETECPIILASEKLWQVQDDQTHQRPLLFVQFPKLGYKERLEVWTYYAGGESETLDLAALANHFQFSPGQIRDAFRTARNIALWENDVLSTAHLLEASRSHSNQNLAELAQKVVVRVGWDDLILPEDPLTQLRELTNQARNRPTVHDAWGFGRKLPGRGISALFTGEPGTGKTMSAGIIARDLGLDLYKVDLSSLVSKYIGETEKNLDRVFTEANTSNAVLFFDEADSIFGKRSEVKDSHDRYANLEISYLLQRVESYDGIAILATNMRANLDEAFTRRFDFITDFPFPDPTYREQIWRIHFPASTPIGDDIDFPLLAQRFRLAGGNIRKIVLSAAFLAAQDDEPIFMRHIMHAVKREYQKMGRLIEDELFQ